MCLRVCWRFLAFSFSIFSFSICSLASRKVMGDTSVYILCNMLELWSSLEDSRQCCKKLTVAVSVASGFGFFSYSFHPPILLLKAAFVMRMGSSQQLQNFPQQELGRSQQALQGNLVPWSQMLTNTAILSFHAGSNWPFAYVLLAGEVAAEPFGEVWGCVIIPCWLHKKQRMRAKDSVPLWSGVCVLMEGCRLHWCTV